MLLWLMMYDGDVWFASTWLLVTNQGMKTSEPNVALQRNLQSVACFPHNPGMRAGLKPAGYVQAIKAVGILW